MSYLKHNFQSGDKLYAHQLNEMDNQIATNESVSIKKTAQALSDAEKAQALANLGINASGTSLEGTVRYDGGQSLTEAQKKVARDNIGATDGSELGSINDEVSKLKEDLSDISEQSSTRNLLKDNLVSHGADVSYNNNAITNLLTDTKTTAQIEIDTYNDSTKVGQREYLTAEKNKRYTLTLTRDANYNRLRLYHAGSARNLGIYIDVSGIGINEYYTLSYTVTGVQPNIVGGFAIHNIQIEIGRTATEYIPPVELTALDKVARDAIPSISATETAGDLFPGYNLPDVDMVSLLTSVRRVNTTGGATVSKDISHIAKGQGYSWRVDYASAGSADVDFVVPTQNFSGLQEVVLRINVVSDAARDCNAFFVTDYYDSTIPGGFSLHPGENNLRLTLADIWHMTTYQSLKDKTWSKIKLRINPNAPCSVYVLDIVKVMPNKAKIMFIDDHAYKNFMDVGYPQLKALKIPVTWGLKIALMNEPIEYASRIINEEEVETLASDSYSEINFHSYYGRATSNMTADECRDDVAKAQHWLRKRGLYREPKFRSAWVQNQATNAYATDDMLDFASTHDGAETLTCFPFKDNHNIPRVAVHYGKNWLDNWFDGLKLSHGVMVIYTHDISDLETSTHIHSTADEWSYFMLKLTTAINEGWLEGVTMSSLMTKYRKSF